MCSNVRLWLFKGNTQGRTFETMFHFFHQAFKRIRRRVKENFFMVKCAEQNELSDDILEFRFWKTWHELFTKNWKSFKGTFASPIDIYFLHH